MRKGLEDSALRSAYQRTIGLLEAFATIAPSGSTRLQQRKERNRTSTVQCQIKGQLSVLSRRDDW